MMRRMCSLVFSVCALALTSLPSVADVTCGRCGCVMHTNQPQTSCWNCNRPLGGPAPSPAPARPIHIESGRFEGFTPDGGINTSGVTVFDSVNDPFRDSSRFNGTMRRVNRPLRDSNGRIVGWQEGWAWQNDVTGQTHFEGQNVTNNGLGGTNTQLQFRSGKRSVPVSP
jgi:hypothetical protein